MPISETGSEAKGSGVVTPGAIERQKTPRRFGRRELILFQALVTAGLLLLSMYSLLLFLSIIQISTIAVAFSAFLVGWLSLRFTRNRLYLFLGVTYLVAGAVDLLHTLAYKGMDVFPGYDPTDPNLATQLWLLARFLESGGLLLAPFFINRRLLGHVIIPLFSLVAAVPVSLIFYGAFPAAYAGGHLTLFKVASEYVICAILVLAFYNYRRIRFNIGPLMYRWFTLSIFFGIAAELSFTMDTGPYGLAYALGHVFTLVSFIQIFRCLVVGTLTSPYDSLFRDLERNKQSLASTNDILVLTSTLLRHDMRHNLSVIRLSLDSCEENHNEGPIADALTATDQAAELVVAVGEMEKLAISGGVLTPCSARDAASQAISGCKIPCTIEGDSTVLADKGLVSVIRNLVRNAEIHSQTDRISIVIEGKGKWCEIRVLDWGVGIEESIRSTVFEKGVKSPSSKGLGLGLYIVKKTAERYGGDVYVESNQPRGTAMVIRLKSARTNDLTR
jgi:signal transduction histidine kinase